VEAGLVLDLLSALVDKSLVVVEETGGTLRYGMLEPVRQFGREKLHESPDEAEVRFRHAEHYLALAERAEPELVGPDQGLWLGRLRTEFANLREAHSWSLEPGDEEERAWLRLRLPAALWRFWGGQRFEEGKRWLQTALERDTGEFPATRARALDGLGFILVFQQDFGRAIEALEAAIALYKELGDQSGAALALANLGYAALHGGYLERVPAFVQEGEALMWGDLEGHARAYLRLIMGSAAMGLGDFDSGVAQVEEGLALCRELGDLRNTSMALFMLGMAKLAGGELDQGAPSLEEGAQIARELGDRLGGAYYLLGLGKLAAMRGMPIRTARLWGQPKLIESRWAWPSPHSTSPPRATSRTWPPYAPRWTAQPSKQHGPKEGRRPRIRPSRISWKNRRRMRRSRPTSPPQGFPGMTRAATAATTCQQPGAASSGASARCPKSGAPSLRHGS
jgi:tetratricopeptide (TPR) repeat protein